MVEGVPVSEIVLNSGPSIWSGGIRILREVKIHENSSIIDMAILYLQRRNSDTICLPLASEAMADLQSGTEVTLLGYATEEADLENRKVNLSSYEGKCDLDVTQGSLGRGMSGAPVLVDGQVVGIVRARNLEDNKSYLVRLNSFRDFLHANLPNLLGQGAKHEDQEKADQGVDTDSEFFRLVVQEVAKLLNANPCPPVRERLEAELKPQDGDVAWALCAQLPRDAIKTLRKAVCSCLKILKDAGEDTHNLIAKSQMIMGWLVLLSVKEGWIEENWHSFEKTDVSLKLELPVQTDDIIQIVLSRGKNCPAQFSTEGTLRGRGSLSHALPETGPVGDDRFVEFVRSLWKEVIKDETFAPPLGDRLEELNETLLDRKDEGEIYYVPIPSTEHTNPLLNERLYKKVREKLPALWAIHIGIQGGDEIIIGGEPRLRVAIREFLKRVR